MKHLTEVLDLTIDLQDKYNDLSDFEALQIATKIQRNRIFAEAFLVDTGVVAPVALEAIAMALGYTNACGSVGMEGITIVDAINGISEAIENKDFYNPNND